LFRPALHPRAPGPAALAAAAAINPKLTRLVRLQLRYMFEQNNPLEVLDRVAKLEKASALNAAEAAQYREWAWHELLALATDYPAFKACLGRIPREMQEGELCAPIAEKMLQIGQYPRVVERVKTHYPKHRNAQLLPPMIEAARYLSPHEQQKIMDTVEGWLHDAPQDASLLLHLGQMAYAKQLWGKAQGYLEASLQAQATPQARLVLAKVFDEMDKPKQAEQQRHPHLYWEFAETNQIAVRRGDWKLVVIKGVPHLYNLETDLHEDHDLAAEHPAIVQQLVDIIYQEHVDSPLFPVTLPPKSVQ